MLTLVKAVSTEGWSQLMFTTIDSENKATIIFYLSIIIFISYILLSMFVAVITETFSRIRSEAASGSAFKDNEKVILIFFTSYTFSSPTLD
jgi:hypothetical protein